jgi:MFS family permease
MQSILATTIFLSAVGMFQFGFSASALNQPQSVVENFFIKSFKERGMGHLSRSAARTYFSIVTSLFLVGGIIGALASSWIANTFGRRNGLIYFQLISITGAILGVLCTSCNSFEMLMVSRLFTGFGSGVHTVLVPIYVSEISPIYMRGSAGVLCTLANTFGLLFAMVLGLKELLGCRRLWSVILAVPGIAGLIQFAFLPMMPESPRYLLLTKRNLEEGTKALIRLRGTSKIEGELYEILNDEKLLREHVENYGSFGDSKENLLAEGSMSVYNVLRSPQYYLSLFVCACVQVSQQATGITVLLFYSTSFFQDAGLGCNLSRYATIR